MFNSNTKPVLFHIYLAMIVVLLSACGSSTPSEANAKSELEKGRFEYYIKNGVIKIDSLVKVNGQASEFMGVKGYAIDYQAELVFLKDVTYRDWDCINLVVGHCGENKVGDKMTFKGEMTFKQTEKGWKGPSGAVY